MDKDNFKDFIQANKDQFDSIEPSPESWNKIEQRVYKDKPLIRTTILLRVAASLFLILGAAWIGIQIVSISQDQVAVEEAQSIEDSATYAFNGMSDELVEVEKFYVSEVNLKEEKLANYQVDKDLMEEVEKLKLEFDQLKEEMSTSADPMRVVEALINNYQLRLEILQSILDQLEKEKRKELQKENQNESIV